MFNIYMLDTYLSMRNPSIEYIHNESIKNIDNTMSNNKYTLIISKIWY
jgi:hypothetical protein